MDHNFGYDAQFGNVTYNNPSTTTICVMYQSHAVTKSWLNYCLSLSEIMDEMIYQCVLVEDPKYYW